MTWQYVYARRGGGVVMKGLIAIGWVLLAASSVRSQFVFLEQHRAVSARAELRRTDHPLPENNYHLIDNPTRTTVDLGPFNETVTADVRREGMEAHATAWQESDLSAMQLLVRGGPRDVGAFLHDPANNFAFSRSEAQVTFRLEAPSYVHIFAELVDAPNFYDGGELWTSGDVSFSLTGPNFSLIQPPNNDVVFERPADIDTLIDVTPRVEPGDYILDLSATHASGGDARFVDGYYDVQLRVFPIPEPYSIVLVVMCIAAHIARRHWFAHFGK
jgi:hypothetical protein